MFNNNPKRLGMLLEPDVTLEQQAQCDPFGLYELIETVTSTPQRSQTTPLYLIRLYFPQAHS